MTEELEMIDMEENYTIFEIEKCDDSTKDASSLIKEIHHLPERLEETEKDIRSCENPNRNYWNELMAVLNEQNDIISTMFALLLFIVFRIFMILIE